MKTKKKTVVKKVIEFQDIREEIKEKVRKIDEAWFELSQELEEVYSTSMFTYWGFDTFREYIENELNIEYRTAMYRVKIGKAIRDYNIKKSEVVNIGWAKFKEIIPHFTDNHKHNLRLISMAKKMSLRELQKALKKGGKKENAYLKITLTFNKEQAEILEEAFKIGEEILGTNDKNRILEAIIADWIANHR